LSIHVKTELVINLLIWYQFLTHCEVVKTVAASGAQTENYNNYYYNVESMGWL